MADQHDDPAVEIPIDGTLDLHTFRPSEVNELLPEYLEECRRRGILQVRVVHGKGTGALKRTVLALLARAPAVEAVRAAGEGAGGWGATLVILRPLDDDGDARS
jgi:DNA-nicking Smr family endonuclease